MAIPILRRRKELVPIVSVLPASPEDGEEVMWRMQAGYPIWRMRYEADWTSDDRKWQCIGGTPVFSQWGDHNSQSGTGSYATNKITNPPAVTLPRAGWWIVEFSAYINRNADQIDVYLAINDTAYTNITRSSGFTGWRNHWWKQAMNAPAGVVQMQYGQPNAQSFTMGDRMLSVMPLRVA